MVLFLGEIKTKPELFLKLTKRISRPDYTMHFMEDRNGRKAMFYNYKGPEFNEGDSVPWIHAAMEVSPRTTKYFDPGKIFQDSCSRSSSKPKALRRFRKASTA